MNQMTFISEPFGVPCPVCVRKEIIVCLKYQIVNEHNGFTLGASKGHIIKCK